MSAHEMERTLARLYTDSRFRDAFLCNPSVALRALNLTVDEQSDLAGMDRAGLVMAALSYQHKRERRAQGRRDAPKRLAKWIREALGLSRAEP
jgi:hypothetical protein